jgi:hypothetical protein
MISSMSDGLHASDSHVTESAFTMMVSCFVFSMYFIMKTNKRKNKVSEIQENL